MTLQCNKKRDFYFDNLKGILIFFVILAHLIPKNENIFFDVIISFICMFHMPFFILISGYFSRNKEKQVRNIFIMFVLYYILSLLLYIFKTQQVYVDFNNIYNIDFGYKLFLVPLTSVNHVSWYLAVLCLLRVFAPAISNIKNYHIIAFFIGIIATMIDLNYYATRRMWILLPFFTLGLFLSQYNLNEMKKYFVKKSVAILGLIGCFFVFLVYFYILKHANIDFSLSLFELGSIKIGDLFSNPIYLIMYDIAYYIISILIIYFIACIVNDKEFSFTKWGRNSLTIYYFHGFFTLLIRLHILKSLLRNYGSVMILLVLILSVALSILLAFIFSRDLVTKYTIQPIKNFASKALISNK